jgi:putative membrane protein
MVSELGWATVPIVTLVSFTFMGIEGIAEQIEMPFGKHICLHYAAIILTGPSQALMKLIYRWVGLHITLSNTLLTRRMFTDRYCSDLKEEIK